MLGDGGLTPPEAFRRALADLLPGGVALAVWDVDVHEAELHPDEEAAVRKAVPARRAEFARGRACARAALAALGVRPVPVQVGPDREPMWPDGVVGSITHAHDRIAAAVAPVSSLDALGIDVETSRPLPPDVRDEVVLDEDRIEAGSAADLVVFSAKEALFKAIFPGTRVWMGFDAVVLRGEAGSRELAASPSGRAPAAPGITELQGAYRVTDDCVTTAFWRPAGPGPTGIG